MSLENKCPKCSSVNVYHDGNVWTCPECFHEWNESSSKSEEVLDDSTIRDANGNALQDGDSVTVIKELRIKGTSSAVKVGTKVKNIRLTDGGDGHNISCKIDGIGAMNLKSEFVRKV